LSIVVEICLKEESYLTNMFRSQSGD